MVRKKTHCSINPTKIAGDRKMKNKPLSKKEIPQSGKQDSHTTTITKPESKEDKADKSSHSSNSPSPHDNNSVGNLKSRIKSLEIELVKKESEINFLKDKLTNNQDVLLDLIEDKKSLKKLVHDYELKEIDERLNNFRDLQRKQHKIEHRLFVTKQQLDEARELLDVRKKVIEDLEKRGVKDCLMANYTERYVQYQKNRDH
jgi:chromosome segregation ATPase